VTDRVEGALGGAAVTRLLLHPSVDVELGEGGALLRHGDVAARISTDLPLRVEEAVWWPDLGVEVTTRRLVLEVGRGSCEGRFALAAASG
jgi:hypothetical protein